MLMADRQPKLGPCIFCGQPSSKNGEHVLPTLLTKRWRLADGPYTYEINGQPIRDRDEHPRRVEAVSPYRLPVCAHHNNELNRLYEQPAKCSLRAVLDCGVPLEKSERVQAFALWWIKTLLLLLHPALQPTFPGLEAPNGRDLAGTVYTDLVTGLPPADVSLWLALADDTTGCARLPEPLRIHLPTTFDPEGIVGEPATLLYGFSQGQDLRGDRGETRPQTRVLLAQLVLHPLSDFEHPFEQAGLIVRLWPKPPARVDIGALPVLDAKGRQQLGALFVCGHYAEHLLAHGWRAGIPAVPGGGSLMFPQPVPPSLGSSLIR